MHMSLKHIELYKPAPQSTKAVTWPGIRSLTNMLFTMEGIIYSSLSTGPMEGII